MRTRKKIWALSNYLKDQEDREEVLIGLFKKHLEDSHEHQHLQVISRILYEACKKPDVA